MEMWQQRKGVILNREVWESYLNEFWEIFEKERDNKDYGRKLPIRPVDAWERYVRVMGLERVL